MRFVHALVVCALFAWSTARADSPKLADARQAIDEVRYDEAQRLLVAALQDGGNSPQALAEIYQLSARTAVALQHFELAEQYYRRWIALEPDATLSDDVAPKLHDRFVAAQAYMAAHGRLRVIAKRDESGAITVIVESDPLAMVAGVATDGAPVPLGVDHPAQLPAATIGPIQVLDDHGNQLLALDASAVARVTAPVRTPLEHHRGVLAQPLAWAVPAVVLGGAGLGFGLGAAHYDDELTKLVAMSKDHYYSDATFLLDRRKLYAGLTTAALVAGGACAVTAIVLAIVEHVGDSHVAQHVAVMPTGVFVFGAW